MAASRCVAAPIAAGFHHTASLPGLSATTAWPIPTERAPTGRRRNNAPSVARPVCACATSAAEIRMAPRRANDARLERSSLIREHDGDVVPHRVLQLAGVADEARLIGSILQLALALRADENGQQLRGERHEAGS